MQIAEGCAVTLEYRLTDADGEVIDASPTGEPLVYVHGMEGILPVLEQELAGKSAGEAFDITITPEQGFGERDASLVEVLSRAQLAEAPGIEVGMQVERRDSAGATQVFVVTACDAQSVTVDANHPLAGRNLRFSGKVIAVREATPEELGDAELSSG